MMQRRIERFRNVGWMILVGIGWPAQALAQGCAMCQTLVGGPDDPLGKAMNTSILFMMSMPFVLMGSVGAWLFYMHRRNRDRRSIRQMLPMRREGAS